MDYATGRDGEVAVSDLCKQESEDQRNEEHHPKPPTTFSDLPGELRNMIWTAALVPRVILVSPNHGEYRDESNLPADAIYDTIPGILHVNRESRSIALEHYDQRFTLTFSKPYGCMGRSPPPPICRIPIIMASCDEIAFSVSQVCAQIGPSELTRVEIEVPDGAPQPWITRLCLLGDRLTRRGIDTERLARILDPWSSEWYFDDDPTIYKTQGIDWMPFNQWPELGLSDEYSEEVETLWVDFHHTGMEVEDWLGGSFNGQCRNEKEVMDRDGLDAVVYDMRDTWLRHTDVS
ncbi:hypothetical protein Daus18300_011961 [Diaporthe australafricana]|uniref:2EXR domain-containing protein n=1 Tax=Diaporthe australafricana TaxID=127596 RepID=A0ABR3W4G2_9PEZI